MAIINKIESHFDDIDEVKEKLTEDINNLFEKLNVKNFVSTPGKTTDVLILAIRELMIKRYIKQINKE